MALGTNSAKNGESKIRKSKLMRSQSIKMPQYKLHQ